MIAPPRQGPLGGLDLGLAQPGKQVAQFLGRLRLQLRRLGPLPRPGRRGRLLEQRL